MAERLVENQLSSLLNERATARQELGDAYSVLTSNKVGTYTNVKRYINASGYLIEVQDRIIAVMTEPGETENPTEQKQEPVKREQLAAASNLVWTQQRLNDAKESLATETDPEVRAEMQKLVDDLEKRKSERKEAYTKTVKPEGRRAVLEEPDTSEPNNQTNENLERLKENKIRLEITADRTEERAKKHASTPKSAEYAETARIAKQKYEEANAAYQSAIGIEIKSEDTGNTRPNRPVIVETPVTEEDTRENPNVAYKKSPVNIKPSATPNPTPTPVQEAQLQANPARKKVVYKRNGPLGRYTNPNIKLSSHIGPAIDKLLGRFNPFRYL